jgi:hypothetical protein
LGRADLSGALRRRGDVNEMARDSRAFGNDGSEKSFSRWFVGANGARLLIGLATTISFVLSVSLWFGGNEQQGIFVGLWVPSILALGAMIVPVRSR